MPAEPARRLDADDPFDACLDTEEAHLSAGWAEGERAGRKEGAAEGRALGVSTGFDVGALQTPPSYAASHNRLFSLSSSHRR
jgi:hypothetical protein